jgi:hypothetical protein
MIFQQAVAGSNGLQFRYRSESAAAGHGTIVIGLNGVLMRHFGIYYDASPRRTAAAFQNRRKTLDGPPPRASLIIV